MSPIDREQTETEERGGLTFLGKDVFGSVHRKRPQDEDGEEERECGTSSEPGRSAQSIGIVRSVFERVELVPFLVDDLDGSQRLPFTYRGPG